MAVKDIIAIVVTLIGVISFATLFTILYYSYATSQISEIQSGKRDIELIDEVIYESQKNVQRRRKATNIIRSVTFYLIIVILVPILIFSLINKIGGDQIMIGGNTVMVIPTDSMSIKNEQNAYLFNNNLDNQIQPYDIIVLEKYNRSPKLYDVIAFRNNSGVNIVHRIVDIEYGNPTKYITRGDKYADNDAYRPVSDDIIGRYTGKRIPVVGIFVIFLQSYSGIITVVSLIYCLLMIDRVTNKMNKVQEARVTKLKEALDCFDESHVKAIKVEYEETIYYKGYSYNFKEGNFVSKTEITEEDLLTKSNDVLIKEIKDNDSNLSLEEIAIDTIVNKTIDKEEKDND